MLIAFRLKNKIPLSVDRASSLIRGGLLIPHVK